MRGDGALMGEMPTIPLGNVVTRIEAGRSPVAESKPAAPGQWGVLKVSAVRAGWFDSDENKVVSGPDSVREDLEVRPGDLLVSRANTEELVGLACIARDPRPKLLLSDKTLRLHVDERWVVPEFVELVLGSAGTRLRMRSAATGTSGSMKNISQVQIRDLPFPSIDLPQQCRIIEAVAGVDRDIEALERRIEKLRSVEKGYTNSTFADLQACLRKLSDVAAIDSGLTLGSDAMGEGSVELPYLRVANVLDGCIDTKNLKTVRVLRTQAKRFTLKRGDVLLTEGGDLDKLGRGAVWDGRVDPCLHQNHVFRVRCSTDLVPDYLSAYTSSHAGRQYFLRIGKQSTNLASINSSQVKNMLIPVPSVAEQNHFMGPIRALRRQVLILGAQIAKLRTIRRALVEDLLTGRVKVGDL
jgi:type I restriction enzyme S subunit